MEQTEFLTMGCIIHAKWIVFDNSLFGFSFAFGPSYSSGFGSFDWSLFRDKDIFFNAHSDYSTTYPLFTYAAYQCAFAVITPALISGSLVGRMKLIPYMLFIFLWSTLCYDALAHWVWAPNGNYKISHSILYYMYKMHFIVHILIYFKCF